MNNNSFLFYVCQIGLRSIN